MTAEVYNLDQRAFGKHLKSLRKARGYTQEALAKKAKLSPDTIRRLEAGSFSPSLDTLKSVASGFNLRISTMFAAFEEHDEELERELADLLYGRTREEWRLALRFVRKLLEFLDSENES
ncbi:DNA-binding protein [Plesiocystis pacifica SIR-1]|uniref:DNA-binding protein n=1 Tax=Plesiocystis pacifica SIR-1 TaxID=391625 RepID=A6G9Q3_9BACT|nr:helix-turn-helix transcriptional regulator [Plesiocystis pacifica]EDM77447.1 DNA-binding protein [Plesiocystis pacifica SIR-1]